MDMKLIDLGAVGDAGEFCLVVEINGEQWQIPTDEATCNALQPMLDKFYKR